MKIKAGIIFSIVLLILVFFLKFPLTNAKINITANAQKTEIPDIGSITVKDGKWVVRDSSGKVITLPSTTPAPPNGAKSATLDLKAGTITVYDGSEPPKILKKYKIPSFVAGDSTGHSVNPDVNASIGFGSVLKQLKLLANPDLNADPQVVFTKRILNIINFLFALGSALMFFMAVWSGLVYIFSFGNEEATTKAKKNFVNIVIGLVVMLGSFSLLQILRYIVTSGKFGPGP